MRRTRMTAVLLAATMVAGITCSGAKLSTVSADTKVGVEETDSQNTSDTAVVSKDKKTGSSKTSETDHSKDSSNDQNSESDTQKTKETSDTTESSSDPTEESEGTGSDTETDQSGTESDQTSEEGTDTSESTEEDTTESTEAEKPTESNQDSTQATVPTTEDKTDTDTSKTSTKESGISVDGSKSAIKKANEAENKKRKSRDTKKNQEKVAHYGYKKDGTHKTEQDWDKSGLDVTEDYTQMVDGGNPELPAVSYQMPTQVVKGTSIFLDDQIIALNREIRTHKEAIRDTQEQLDEYNNQMQSQMVMQADPMENEIAEQDQTAVTPQQELQLQIDNCNKTIEEHKEALKELRAQKKKLKAERVFNPNDVTEVSNLTAEEIKTILKGTYMEDLADTFYQCEQRDHINALFLMGIAAHESNWGRSRRAIQDHNYTGFGVYSSSAEGINAPAGAVNIETTSNYLKENYLTPGGRFYNGLTVSDVNKKYCTTGGWSEDVVNIAYRMIARVIHE